MIKGEKIYLCAIENEDLPQILIWRNSANLRLNFREYRELAFKNEHEWYNKISSLGNSNEFYFAIKLKDNDEFIGVAGANYIDWINRRCQLSLYIGKDDVYIDENGWAKEVCSLLHAYIFGTLNLHKITAEIFEFDIKKKRLLETMGYHCEGELKENVFKKGKYYASFIYSLLDKD